MKLGSTWHLAKEAVTKWWADNTFQLGAALAYYSVFSLAPILIIAVAVASLAFGEEAARGHIANEIRATVGPRVATAIQETIRDSAEDGSGKFATVISVGILFFSATAVFSQLQEALNTVWGVQTVAGRSWMDMVRDRFWSFTVVLGVGFLLLVSLVLSTALSALATFLTPASWADGIFLWRAIHGLISFGFITVLFAMIYKLLPDVEIAWHDVWVGAAVTALLFTMGKYLIGLYLANSSWVSAYGAAGSLVVVLLWVYYSAQIFLLGAEFTYVHATHSGRPLVLEERAELMTEESRAKLGMRHED
ncbi:MAG: YihY/virulence factor BrkB family protein [Pirellulaceae bacterium]